MWKDPIVQKVRKAGENLAKQAGYDMHTFFQNLRKNEKKRAIKTYVGVTSKEKLKQVRISDVR